MKTDQKLAALRNAYGEVLIELGKDHPELVVMEADLGKSTFSYKFQEVFPDRYINVGIAEQNLIGIASGISQTGRQVFASTLSILAPGRCWDQIRNTLAHSKCNVKVVTSHAGISIGKDGSSHQSLEDIALWRVIPDMKVFVPCDANETKNLMRCLINIPGPAAIRLARPDVPLLTGENEPFHIGKARLFRDGSDVSLLACGLMVHEALKAADQLALAGISCQVVSFTSIKPLDTEMILSCARKTGALVTCEEHSIIGGFGSAVLESLEEESGVICKRIGTQDCWGESGEPEELFEKYGLSSGHIVSTVKNLVAKKGSKKNV